LKRVPTVWDETRVLQAKVADYIAVARRNKDVWYVGAMTDENPRELMIDFSFLEPSEYTIDSYQDGINANRYASDFERMTSYITPNQRIRVHLAPGGGWAARIHRK
jgi:alpha-glucosidase